MFTQEKVFRFLLFGGKGKLYFLLVISLFSGVLDTLGIVSIMPFMTLIANTDLIYSNETLSLLYDTFEFSNEKSFIIFCGTLTFCVLLTSMTAKALTTFYIYKFVLKCEGRLSQLLFRRHLNSDYSEFLKNDTSIIEKQVLSEATIVANNGILPVITIFTQTLIVVLIIAVLLWVDTMLALIAGGTLSLTYIAIYKRNSKILGVVGEKRIYANQRRFKIVSEAFNNIRDIKLGGREKDFDAEYVRYSSEYVDRQATSSILAALPRFLVEGLAFGGMIAITVYLISTKPNFSQVVPIISLYAIAGYRLMPALQQIYASSAQYKFVAPAIDELAGEIFIDREEVQPTYADSHDLTFDGQIQLKLDSYSYGEEGLNVLKDVSITIQKNEMVGIIGPSGSGKTTLMDILAGLLPLTYGQLTVDGVKINRLNEKSWQKKIGYVSQDVVLADDSVRNNVVAPKDGMELDENWLHEVADLVGLTRVVECDLPEKWNTQVGERGGLISGGQRQRVAIARALYQKPAILLLDEATSALDASSENIILETLSKLQGRMTIIVITHRPATLIGCNSIYYLRDGSIEDRTFQVAEDLPPTNHESGQQL